MDNNVVPMVAVGCAACVSTAVNAIMVSNVKMCAS